MRGLILFVLVLACMGIIAQDKIYYLNGATKICTIESITTEYFYIKVDDSEQTVSKLDVLLVEFKNGTVEVFNQPKENITYDPRVSPFADVNKKTGEKGSNYFSINTLALCNADISAFYEYIPKNKPFGFGVMGAYNFNIHSSFQNLFIRTVSNSKKNYDLGVTINAYPYDLSDEVQVYFGMMFKYTDFNFDRVITDSVSLPGGGSQQTVSYSRTSGYQLATLFTAGAQLDLNKQLFIRAFGGIGGFNLRGAYKDEYNREVNNNNTGPYRERTLLLKIYMGVNIGFNF